MGHNLIDLITMIRKRVTYGNKRGPAKRAKTTAALSQRVSRLQRQVALLKPEVKIKYSQGSITNLTTAGSITLLSGIAQGVTAVTRIGDTIRPTRLKLNVKCTAGNDASSSLQGFYYAIVKDKETSGTQPVQTGTVNAIFEGSGPLDAFVQDEVKDKYYVMRMVQHSFNELALGTFPNVVSFDIPLSGVTTYRDTTDVIGSCGKNHYFLVVGTDTSANTADFAFSWQFMFSDV